MNNMLSNLNTVSDPKTLKTKSVEGKLWETLRSLAVTEGNIRFPSNEFLIIINQLLNVRTYGLQVRAQP